ncbi:MAG: hypothetical protein KA270_16225 [Saprospiraceae bacterium]|nr:hypothetical protein [Saprospiraceae bacterium]MBP6568720.1 hypothetical protein [Saprospiraceae bacterium]
MHILYKNSVVLYFHPFNAKSKHLLHTWPPNQVLLPHRQDTRPTEVKMIIHFPALVVYPGEYLSDPVFG